MLILLITLLYLPAQDAPSAPPPEKQTCFSCRGSGLVPCKKHGRDAEELEQGALNCSFLVDCPECQGTLMKPCGKCKNRSADNDRKIAANRTWRQARKEKYDDFMGRALSHCESAHFALIYDIPKLPAAERSFDLHRGMHLYLRRLESFWRDFAKDLAAKDEDFSTKTTVMLWSGRSDQEKASLKYTRQNSSTESKLMGREPVFTVFYDKNFLHEEFELHQAVIHQTSHCLLSNVWDGIWPGTKQGGWFDEGLAHLYEIRYFTGVRHYCYREQDTLSSFKFGKWESETRNLMQQRSGDSLLRPLHKNNDLLTPQEHVLAWSLCDFLRANHADKLGAFARAAKEGVSPGEAVRSVLHESPADFEQRWIDYVKKSYSALK